MIEDVFIEGHGCRIPQLLARMPLTPFCKGVDSGKFVAVISRVSLAGSRTKLGEKLIG